MLSTKDLYVRLATPRFLTQRDRCTVGTIVHNDTPQPRRVQVTIKALSGAAIVGPQAATIEIPPNGSLRSDWLVTPQTGGTAVLQAEATADGGLRDAIRLSVPVIAHGTPSANSASGELVGGETTVSLKLPAGAIRPATKARLQLSGSNAGLLLQALDFLHASDYGTTENAVGWFLPDMTVAMAFRELGYRYPPLEKRLKKNVRRNLRRLYDLQESGYHPVNGEDGGNGWGWSRGAGEDPFWTAYAVYGLEQARRAGFKVRTYVWKGGRRALARLLAEEKNKSNRALICYVLSLVGAPPFEAMAELEQAALQYGAPAAESLNEWRYRPWGSDYPGLQNYGIALLSLAYAEQGETERAAGLARLLVASAKQTSDEAYWPEIFPWGFYSCNDNETTAYAMMALIQSDPENPLIDKAARWLIGAREGAAWASTEDTASIIYGLSAYLLREKKRNPPNFTAKVTLNGEPFATLKVTPKTMFDDHSLAIPVEKLKPGRNTFVLTKEGPGRLAFGASLRTQVIGEDFAAEAAGLAVRREYYRREQYRDLRGKERTRLVAARPPFKSGEAIDVKLVVTASRACREVVIRDPLPAGSEIIESENDYYGYYGYGSMEGEWWNWPERVEARDQEVRFYASLLKKGANVYHYRLRIELPGSYHVLPATAQAQYIPDISGRSAERRLEFTD